MNISETEIILVYDYCELYVYSTPMPTNLSVRIARFESEAYGGIYVFLLSLVFVLL